MSEEQVVQVTNATDLDKIKDLTSGIIGESCRKVYLGYGEELKLDIGAQIDIDLSSRKHTRIVKSAAWGLGSRGTGWKLFNRDGMLITEYHETTNTELYDEIQEKIQLLVDTQVQKFAPTYPNLGVEVAFSNGCKLFILPTEEDNKWDVSYWELAMPHGWLDVGPQLQWTYKRKASKLDE